VATCGGVLIWLTAFEEKMLCLCCASPVVLLIVGASGGKRESVSFIGTRFSNLCTSVDTPTRGRVVVCLVFVISYKYALGHSLVSQPLNLRLTTPPSAP
jgi:hypothetical protein